MKFINQIVMECVVADKGELYNSLKGRKASVVVWHKQNNQEMLIKVISNKYLRQAFLNFEKGDIVTFYGYIIFIERKTKNARPFPIIISDRIRDLDTDKLRGLEFLNDANLSDIIDLKKLSLPWEKE